ncbi:hypothetical protein H9Y05_08800 [Crocinitomicaceae bacterium CZZ-1]|uniref:Lipoprotein n=1 Tax=Taishania pollutisoli TaxID=2766479 RepID=A0A8J6TXI6_9FLAO|nr:hypothetical protein [Taishania pollutisoli]MBC9812566.1 hypothetical protein [Taishania pollutisoli]
MRGFNIIVIVILIISTISCGTTLKRYRTLKRTVTNDTLVTVNMISSSINNSIVEEQYKTIFDLSDRGQQAILTDKTSDKIPEILNQKFQIKQSQKLKTIDLTTKKLRVTFSINRLRSFDRSTLNAYDRIEDLKYTFKLSKDIYDEVKFLKWNKYTTEYGTIDIGTLEYNQGYTADLSINGKIGASYSSADTQKVDENNSKQSSTSLGPEISVGGNFGYTQSRKENQIFKQRYIQFTGEFNDSSFSVHQQGVREIVYRPLINWTDFRC